MGLYGDDDLLYSSDDDDDDEDASLIHSPSPISRSVISHGGGGGGRHHHRHHHHDPFPPSPTSTCSGRSIRSARPPPSSAERKKRRKARLEIEQMLYGNGQTIEITTSSSSKRRQRGGGDAEQQDEEEDSNRRDDQIFWTLSVVLLFILAPAIMGITHGNSSSSASTSSSNDAANVDESYNDNAGMFTDTGEYDKFLRVAPKDVPKIKKTTPAVAASSSSTTSSSSSTSTTTASGSTSGGGVDTSKTNKTESNLAAEDFIKEHAHIEQEKVAASALSAFASYSQLSEGEVLHYQKDVDVPIFWHIPRSGGTTIQDIWGSCLGLTIANNIGVTGGHNLDESIQTFQYGEGATYVNVDTTTKDGLIRAKKLGLVQSDLADVVVTPYLYESADLFNVPNTNKKGRCFTIIRHPIERALSVFFYLQSTSEELKFQLMTIEEYVDSPYCEENWMVRFLTNKLSEPLTNEDLELAKIILERKCLVGLLVDLSESLSRFEKYFGWSPTTTNNECGREQLMTVGENVHKHPHYEKYSHVYNILEEKNAYDLKLYEHATILFLNQAFLFKD